MIDQINELSEDGLESSPETSHYTENKWICWKNHNKLYFLHLVDVLLSWEYLVIWSQEQTYFKCLFNFLSLSTGAYLEPFQTSSIEIFAKYLMLDIRQGFE